MFYRQRAAICSAFVVSILILATFSVNKASADPTNTNPKYGGTLIFLRLEDTVELNPMLSVTDSSNMINNQIYSPLIYRGWDLSYQPDLAESWEISTDGLNYTFQLRHNVKWHDGVPFTSQDVAFTFGLYLNQSLNLPKASTYNIIDHIDTPDNYTVSFILKTPTLTLMPSGFAFWRGHLIIPKHIWEGRDYLTDAEWKNPTHPIGTGPFKFVEWVKGDHLTLAKNRDYYMPGLPYLDKIIYRIVPNAATQVAALEAGECSVLHYIPESEVKRLETLEGIYVFEAYKIGLTKYIGVNQGKGYWYQGTYYGNENPILQNKKVRQALLHAINRQEMIDLAFGGLGRVQHSWISSKISTFYEPNVPKYEYNPTLANQLLDEAGYPRGSDGWRFELSIRYTAGDTPTERASEILRSQFEAVGIRLTLKAGDWAGNVELITQRYDFDLAWHGYSTGADPGWLISYYHSRDIKPGSWNFPRYNNSEVNALWEQSAVTMNVEERVSLFKQMQMIVMEELPILPIQERAMYTAARTEWHGLNETGAYWYSSPFDRVWWEGGSEASPELALAKIDDVTAKLTEWQNSGWANIDLALAKLQEARAAYDEGRYDVAASLATEAEGIPEAPAPIGLYAAIVVLVIVVAALVYYSRRRKT